MIRAFLDPQESNFYWKFLQDIKKWNEMNLPLSVCLDAKDVIRQEYIEAIASQNIEARNNFENWYDTLVMLDAISTEDGLIASLDTSQTRLAELKLEELVFIARAVYNKRKYANGMIVIDTDNEPIREYKKSFYEDDVYKTLTEDLKIRIVGIDEACKRIRKIWDEPDPYITLSDVMYTAFDENELKQVLFLLKNPDINLTGKPRRNQIIEIVNHFKRRNNILELVEVCRKERPLFKGWPQEACFVEVATIY